MQKQTKPWLANFFIFAVAISPFMLFPGLSEFADLPQGAWLQVSCFTLLAYLFFSIARTNKTFNYHFAMLPMALFLLWCMFSYFWAVNDYEVTRRLLSFLASAGAFFLAINCFNDELKIKKFLLLIYYSGFGVAVIGVCQYLFDFSLIPQIYAPASTFANKNMASQFIILTLPIGYILFFTNSLKKKCYLSTCALSIMTAFLVYTKTRSCWLAFFLEIIIFIFYFYKIQKTKPLKSFSSIQIRAFITGILLFTFLIILGKNASFTGLQEINLKVSVTRSYVKNPALQPRFAFWMNSLVIIENFWLSGTGLGNFKIHYPKYSRAILKDPDFNDRFQTAQVHNDFIQIIAELGIIGFALACWFVYLFIRPMKLALSQPYPFNLYTAGMISIFAGFSTLAMLSFPLSCSLPPFIGALFAGLIVVISKTQQTVTARRMPLVLFSLTLCLITFTVSYNYKAISADAFIGADRHDNVLKAAQKAVRTFPHRTKLLFYLGKAAMDQNKYSLAVDAFETMLETHPYDINTLSNLGAAYIELGNYENAQKTLLKTLSIYPEHWAAHNNLGAMMMAMKQYKKAQTHFTSAVANNPGNAQVWFNIGSAALMNNDRDSALKAFVKAVEIDPEMAAKIGIQRNGEPIEEGN